MEGLGYGPSKPLKVKVSTRNIAVYRDPAVILIDQLKKIYIDAELEVIDTSIWHAKVTRGEYSVGLNLTGVGVDDPDVNLYENYSCNSERNYTKYCNKEVDALIDKQSQETDRRQAQAARVGDREEAGRGPGAADHLLPAHRPPAGSPTSRASCCTTTASTTTGASRTCGSTSSAARRAHSAIEEEPSVGAYLVRRFLLMLVTLFGMSILIFVMLRLVPGNITDIIFDSAGFVNPAAKKKIERELGLDQPIAVQYVNWIGGLMRGDLGYAYVSEKPAIDEILPRIPVTAKLAVLALVFSVLFGVPLGVISAVRQNTALDYVLRVISLSGLSLPSFWLGLLILMAFVHWFGWIPIYKSTHRQPLAGAWRC